MTIQSSLPFKHAITTASSGLRPFSRRKALVADGMLPVSRGSLLVVIWMKQAKMISNDRQSSLSSSSSDMNSLSHSLSPATARVSGNSAAVEHSRFESWGELISSEATVDLVSRG